MYQLIALFSLIVLSLYSTVIISNKLIKLDIENVKYPEIDGIRGYLGFFVFLHHSYIWHIYLKSNLWETPKSNIFNHLGQTSVVLFFIITSFLFVTKLIFNKNLEFDWKKYIVSRFYRLFPMYIFTIFILFLIVLFITNFELKDTLFSNLKSCVSWIFFSIDGPSNINSLEKTFLINAGVTWTLPYEWMFYLLLPLIALFFKIKANYNAIILFSLVFLMILFINKPSLKNFIPFLGGILCAVLNNSKIKIDWKNYKFSVLGLSLLFFRYIDLTAAQKYLQLQFQPFFY